ncbi:MAG: LON peptidase substrate-binding domain-containing protein, partial [Chloroflexota bacterium]
MSATKWHILGYNAGHDEENAWLELNQHQFLPTVTQQIGEKRAETSELPDEERLPAIPDELAILPLRGVVVFPLTVVPLTVGQPRSMKLVDDATVGQRIIGLVTSLNA